MVEETPKTILIIALTSIEKKTRNNRLRREKKGKRIGEDCYTQGQIVDYTTTWPCLLILDNLCVRILDLSEKSRNFAKNYIYVEKRENTGSH